MSGILLAHRHAFRKAGLPPIGDPFMGGFLASVIDSTQAGAIPAADQSKTGRRYALVDLGAAAETASAQYKTSASSAPLACQTVWDGLTATQAMIAAGSAYPAAQIAAGYSVPADGASAAYIPAMWELLAMFWYFKNYTDNNYVTQTTGSTFPGGTVQQGYDPASDPKRPNFTTGVPAQTALAAWQVGGAQALQSDWYWTSTEYTAANAWAVGFRNDSQGRLAGLAKNTGFHLRLVRRLYL